MKVRKGSLSEFTLLALEKTIDGLVRMDHFINNPSFYAFGGGWDYPLEKSGLTQTIRRLREKGLVQFEEQNTNQIIVRLTNLGRDALGDLAALEEEWDGKFRIVIFDIPEPKRVVRDLFRRRLRDWGFKLWQKSVWIGKNNVTKKLRQLISKLEIDNWVAVIESNDPTLKNII